VLSVSDAGATSGWTSFSRTFTGSYAGQTVRIRLRSTNDSSSATSFYFDTLALQATVSCP
jgi:hypothetical protein